MLDTQDQGNIRHQEFPSSHLEVLKAFEKRWEATGRLPFETVVMNGQGPFRRGKIWSYLHGLGAEVGDISDIDAPEILIVGREDFDKSAIERLLRRREGKQLRICSQEMILA